MRVFAQPRIYPNLNPSAAVPVDREQVFSLNSFAGNYRMMRGKERVQYVPNARFTFVKLTSGATLMHQRFRHPALAEGRPVLYAGEASFNSGKLEWWSNGSGNYRPDPEHAEQAGLPMEDFYPYEAVIKGEHKRKDAPSLAKAVAPLQAKLGFAHTRAAVIQSKPLGYFGGAIRPPAPAVYRPVALVVPSR